MGDLMRGFATAVETLTNHARLEMDEMPLSYPNRVRQAMQTIGRPLEELALDWMAEFHRTEVMLAREGYDRWVVDPVQLHSVLQNYHSKHRQYKSLINHLKKRVFLVDGLYLQENWRVETERSMHFSQELSELAAACMVTLQILAHRRLACNWPHRQ